MLSPDGLSPKASAPSIWSFDSGYASNSLFEEEVPQLSQSQPAETQTGSLVHGIHPRVSDRGDSRAGGFWNNYVGERLRVKREEATIDPIVTKLSVFTTKDTSDNDFFLPEIPNEGETCLTCEFLKITGPGENLRCEECQIPEIIEPSSLLLANGSSKGKEPFPRLDIPQETTKKQHRKIHTSTRCSACELSSLIDPFRTSSCPSCCPNPSLLSPISPSSADFKVKRSRAGRNSKLPLSALNRLQSWLDANQDNPYPSAETKRQLAQDCGITEKQVTTWFTNARARQLNPLETYLSSGSEDEGARESDIASAADTPTYTGGFTFLSETRPSGYRRAGSVSGSSAFSGSQSRLQPSRRGKKKNYRRSNQPPQITELTSPTSNPGNGQSDQETWQCTFCYRHLVPKSWRRHEETQHRPKAQWTCMLYGPRLSFPSRSNSSSCCAFCMAKDPSEDHFLHNHRISECAKRPIGDRTFYRPDHLRQHVKNFHGATLYDIVQGRWKRAAEAGTEGWTCGFCGERLETWDKRETHIANHFKDGLTMESWQQFPEPNGHQAQKEDKRPKYKQEKEKEKDKDHPHGLARLSRTFTRRSTRRSEHTYALPQSQMQSPFSNTFAALPTNDPASTAMGLGISTAPVLPDINLDPLMVSNTGGYLDWTTTAALDQQFPMTAPDPVFDPPLPSDFGSGLNMDLYDNDINYQGPWN